MLSKTTKLSLTFLLVTGCAVSGSNTEPNSVFFVDGDRRSASIVYASDEVGGVQMQTGDEAGADVVTYTLKAVHWPTATVKELRFSEENGGILHPITNETTVYVLKGRVEVTVNGHAEILGEGDIASLPEDALRDVDGPSDAVVIAWTAPSLQTNATPAVVRAGEAEESILREGILKVRRYAFPGNSVRVAKLREGLETSPATAKTDSLIYVINGTLTFHQGGQTFNASDGDFIREVAGIPHYWKVPRDSTFVTTSGLPIGAEPIDPEDATDIPK